MPLRDIHLPEPVSWWPLAPGWWVVLGLIVILGLLLLWVRYLRQYQFIAKLARGQLQLLRSDSALSNGDKIRALSILMRRVSISAFPRVDSASLTGVEWLQFLDSSLTERAFSEGPGRALLDGPYKPSGDIDLAPVFKVCEKWIGSLPKKKIRISHRSSVTYRNFD